ncbi:MAG: dethiobiotin synthase [Deltaproteobacteria bacterium]|nr:dethiobiotin synthase [Deltaproteobacteria bacterium]
MNNGFFITGTDTGVGKTVVAATLAYALHQRHISFSYIKPVESGISSRRHLENDSDAALVKRAGTLPESLKEIVPFTFKEPLAPLLAARRAGIEITKESLIDSINDRINPSRLTIIEGAGGLLAPLCNNFLILDLIRELRFPTLLVCRTSLGSINHTLLTLDRLRREGINPIGIIANHVTAPGIAEEEFIAQLTEFDPVTILGESPYMTNLQPNFSDWQKLTPHIDIETLLKRTNFTKP